MSRGIILYQSKYGATKKYADWLVEETGYDCIETNAPYPALITPEQGERRVIEEND